MRILATLTLLAAISASAAQAAALTLSAEGASQYVIVVAKDATKPENTAARELQSHLQTVTGATFLVRHESDVPATAKQIVVGPTARFRATFPDFDLNSLRRDGIVMKTKGDQLFLAGDRPRGTLYAVYSFLEDIVGCRWWSATEHFTPHVATLRVPELNTVYVPKLLCREAFYRGAFDGVYAARSKCNGHFERISEEYGGHYSILGWCHTFNQLLPPDTYFPTHPEWFSEINGKRVGHHSQLCLTNTEMRAEFIKKALEWVRKDPNAGIISISQNDWHNRCTCEACAAVEEKEGAPSGLLIHFVNAVAEEIEKEFPDMLIETLAYQYTRKAPKHVRPRKNVIIRLCSIECSYAQPLGTGPQNEGFKRDIEEWSALAHQLYIWNYVTNFANYILPHPNMRVLAPNIRLFVDHKTIGLFEQGDSGCSCSDFPELRAWLLAHLMWDPSRDDEALITEFLNGYYGPAAKPIQDYIDLIHDAAEEADVYLRCYMPNTSAWFPLEAVTRADALFDEAEKRVADLPALLERVQRARMPLRHVWLQRYAELKEGAETAKLAFRGPEDPVAGAKDFVADAHRFAVGNYREGGDFNLYAPVLLDSFRPPCPPAKECDGLAEEDFADVQDNRFKLFSRGKFSDIVDDPTASDQRSARMTTNHTQWAVQFEASNRMARLGRARCYAEVRCDAKTESGSAFRAGLYDTMAKAGVFEKTLTVQEAAGKEYRTIDLGTHDLKKGMYFWFAPMNNPDAVEAVFVDRIFCIREK
jgi:uncharacterized protein DUF4838/glycosyl hydrolase family 67